MQRSWIVQRKSLASVINEGVYASYAGKSLRPMLGDLSEAGVIERLRGPFGVVYSSVALRKVTMSRMRDGRG
jgi:hypothetical protein